MFFDNTTELCRVQSWLSHIGACHSQPLDLSLERVRCVAERMQLLNFDCPVITVGGTNGKGSCVATLTAVYQAAGYRVGTFTSPHLLRFNERIRLNGREASDAELCQAFTVIETARKEVTLTFFEFSTLAALYLFHSQSLDIVVLEVGLGGRFDAVNIVDPTVSVVTSIALDHMSWLGDTREAIAFEKAGIFRAERPVVCGEVDPPESLLREAHKKNSPFFQYGVDFEAIDQGDHWHWKGQGVTYSDLPRTALFEANLASALQTIALLSDVLPVEQQAISSGLRHVQLPGRWQQVSQTPAVFLDVAHNPAASALLGEKIKTLSEKKRVIALFSCLADKDLEGLLAPHRQHVTEWHVAPLAAARAMPVKTIMDALQARGWPAYNHSSVAQGYADVVAGLAPDDALVVFGSFYTVAEVLSE